ncbi:MAG: hypothetical protein P8181_10680 [bacterium]
MESGSPNRLYAVWGTAPDDVFISGHLATILHYDGSEWNTMNGGVRRTFWGVWGAAANDVFVVGGAGAIVHYDGSSWTPMSSGASEDLLDVWGISASEVYAVGRGGTIIRYDGHAWTAVTSGTTMTINGIFGTSSDDIVAVGEHGIILRFLGGGVPVFIQDFGARPAGAAVELHWRVRSARGLRGFRLLKRDAFDHESTLPAGGGLLGNDGPVARTDIASSASSPTARRRARIGRARTCRVFACISIRTIRIRSTPPHESTSRSWKTPRCA